MSLVVAFSPTQRSQTNALRQSLSHRLTIDLHHFSHGGRIPLYCTVESSMQFPERERPEYEPLYDIDSESSSGSEDSLFVHHESIDSEDCNTPLPHQHVPNITPETLPTASMILAGPKALIQSDFVTQSKYPPSSKATKSPKRTHHAHQLTHKSFNHFRIQSITIHGGDSTLFNIITNNHNDSINADIQFNAGINMMAALEEEEDEDDYFNDMEDTHKGSIIIHQSVSSVTPTETLIDKKRTVTFQEAEAAIDPKRNYIQREIIATEETYYRGLDVLLTELLIPMFDTGLIEEQYYSQCISNLPELIEFHDRFLTQLIDAYEREEDTKEDEESFTSIAQVFSAQDKEEFVELYMKYIRDYDAVLDLFGNTFHNNVELQAFLKQKRKEKKPLTNYLILPVQRVPRYILLFTDLKKHTKPSDKDYKNIESALELVEEITKEINERQRQIENMSQCLQIQESLSNLHESIVKPDRTYLRQFVFVKKSNKHQRQFFCFNDIIIVTNHHWVVKQIMDIRNVDIKRHETSTLKKKKLFQLSCSRSKEDICSYISNTEEDMIEFERLIIDNQLQSKENENKHSSTVLRGNAPADTQQSLNRQLLNACRYGHVSEVDVLLSKGANLEYSDADDPFGATCLSEAARRGEAEIAQLLIERGMSVNDKISQGFTALHLACERGHISVVRVLLNNQCDPYPLELFNLDSPLHYAAANDHSDICALLIEEGNVNVNIQNRTGDTPLHVAVANDRLNSTHQLLTLHADLNIMNYAGMTPVMVAQLATCKHAIETMNPFILKLAENEQMEKDKLQQQRIQTRCCTFKKALESRDGDMDACAGDEYKSMDTDRFPYSALPDGGISMSGKRDAVFKKGFMQKQGKKIKHFHDRYFILWSTGFMNYYAKEHTIFANLTEKSKPGGSPLLEGQESCDEISSTTHSPKKKTHKKRKSTLHKLGLKSDVIKAKGIIDINDLIETQFLQFPGGNGCGWALITPGREWKFKCASDKERREWIAAVHAVNYGISPFDIKHLGMSISYEHNTMLLEPASNAFVSGAEPVPDHAVASGWMFKLGASPKGLEHHYWKKRWVSLYKKPARLAYAQHPYSMSDVKDTSTGSSATNVWTGDNITDSPKKGKNSVLKGVIQLNDVTNIIKIGDNDIIKKRYRAPTVHVFALITEKRTWVFATKTAEECGMWHDRISFFLPNQWKKTNDDLNVEELLSFNRVKTLKLLPMENDDGTQLQHLDLSAVRRKKKKSKKGDRSMMSKLFRKVSNVAETLGITEQYAIISEVQPRGVIPDYDGAHALPQTQTQTQNVNESLENDT